jgi:hypothetical protein
MGIVTDKLIEQIRVQIGQKGTVVWYDPERHYEAVAARLSPDDLNDARIFRYSPDAGFFELRQELEAHWGSLALDRAPRLLIYVPMPQSETLYALIEYEVGGVVMQPGQQPPEHNTALSGVARLALEAIFPLVRLEEIVNEVSAGKLTLAELDQLAERGAQAQIGTLSVIFGTGNATEVVLRFLTSPEIDGKIHQRKAVSDVATLLEATLGIRFEGIKESAQLRAKAAWQVLITDFLVSIAPTVPESLKTLPIAAEVVARQAAVELAHQWRNRRDVASSYVERANHIQAELGIGSLGLPLETLAQSETFLAAEQQLQVLVEESLIKRSTNTLMDLVRDRQGRFWANQVPQCKTRWGVIWNAARVLQEASRIETGIKGKQWTASKLFAQYAYGDSAWCQLDTAQRHLERDIHRYEVNLENHDALQRLIARASLQYASTINRLAELFVLAYREEHFHLRDIQLQADVYRDFVAPRVRSKRVAYFLVDAFRYEMAREFHTVIECGETNWRSELTPALATPPTITDVGMAALMPGAADGIALQSERGKLIPYIGGEAVRDAKSRFELLKIAVGHDVPVITLDDISPLRKKSLRKALDVAKVVVVTASDDIDGLGENMPPKARRSMDDVLNLLRRGLSALFGSGFEEVIITADHGFILADRLDDGQKIEPPGGNQVVLKRRVWVGQGGASHEAVLRTPLSSFGIGGDLEMATPLGLAAFKVQGGNSEYFHGGLALQEVVIPVLVVAAGASAAPSGQAKLSWKVSLGSKKITSPYLSVTVEAFSLELLPIEPPSIRVEVRAGAQILSVPVSASYGFQDMTKDVKLRTASNPQETEPNSVVIHLTEKPISATVDIHLLDANTGVSLHQLDKIEVDLSLLD